MHPSLVLTIWLFAILLIQVMPPALLLPSASLGFLLGGAAARRHFVLLLARSRWILLTLLLTFLLMTPGERLLPGLPLSVEGLATGGEHLLRLVAVLLAVAWLVGGRPVEWLLAALWGLLSPLRWGRSTALIVRLALTLRYAGGQGGAGSWRRLLAGTSVFSHDEVSKADSSVELSYVSPTFAERAGQFLLLVIGGLILWGFR